MRIVQEKKRTKKEMTEEVKERETERDRNIPRSNLLLSLRFISIYMCFHRS